MYIIYVHMHTVLTITLYVITCFKVETLVGCFKYLIQDLLYKGHKTGFWVITLGFVLIHSVPPGKHLKTSIFLNVAIILDAQFEIPSAWFLKTTNYE